MGALRGTLIAFLGGLFYTAYVFLCDSDQREEKDAWPLFGIELLSTAMWACLVVLLFGDWQAVHPQLPKDIGVVFYVSIACTFVPTLIAVLLQKYISPVTVSFIYILEPVLGALIAYLYLHETLPVQGYAGGGLVVLGALINTWGTIGQSARRPVPVQSPVPARARASWVSTILYPGVICMLGAALLYYLGRFPPASWREAYQVWPQVSQQIQEGQGTYVTLLLVQAGGWLVAWVSVLVMGWLALYHLLQRLFQSDRPGIQEPPVIVRRVARPEARPVSAPAPMRAVRTGERPLLQGSQPVRRARPTVRLPEYTQSVPVSARQLSPRVQPAEPAGHLSEQSTWYGEAVWNDQTGFASGKGRSIPLTEPLPPEAGLPLKRRASLAQQREIQA
jgi:EamA-like transporter family